MTIAEKAWMDDLTTLGCIVCCQQGHPGTPAEIHHVLFAGRRQSDLETIGLCPGHHRTNDEPGKISRHPWRKRFEAAYGTEAELLQATRTLVSKRRKHG